MTLMFGEARLGEKVSNVATLFLVPRCGFPSLQVHPTTPTVFRVHLSQSPCPGSFLGVLPSESWGVRAVLVPVDLEPSSGFYPERQVRRLPL